ncbi:MULTISPECIES: potassium channel family protein [unclassified Curtobacterium]|uniref:potassium channel family protein n=1 Tax=unclassified Curtobacterium TaxID=257496 RepID=UPI0021ACF721|nr:MULTISPECIES: potassium channel family protein [unclassified Curtobacterium]
MTSEEQRVWDQARWQRMSQWPLTVAAVAFLVAFAVQVLADLHGAAALPSDLVINATWVMFAVDYVVMLVLAEHRGRWFRRHLLDLAAIALPTLRPLRLLRLVQLFRVLQRTTGTAVRGRVIIYVTVTTALLVFVAALAMLDVERHAPHATITDFGAAIWWALVTITTVGYGDVVPVTPEGRLIAAAVMIGGIALIGVVTATLASWIIDQVGRRDEESQAVTQRQVRELAAEIRALRAELADARTAPTAGVASAATAAATAPAAAAPTPAGTAPAAAAAAPTPRTTPPAQSR